MEKLPNDFFDNLGDAGIVFKTLFGGGNPLGHHKESRAYLTTNERIYAYQHLFEGRKKMFSITGSSEQIFNAILEGVEEVHALDISKNAEKLFYLRRAALLGLTEEEYIKFFIDGPKGLTDDTLDSFLLYQDKIRQHLSYGASFWDQSFEHLFNWELICSSLFLGVNRSKEEQIRNNKFLQGNNYEKLKARIKDARVLTQEGDIRYMLDRPTYQSEYDLIYLSNLQKYIYEYELKGILEQFKTTPNGIVLFGMSEDDINGGPGATNLETFTGSPYVFTKKDGYFVGERRK